MKATIFHITAILTMVLFMTNITTIWFLLGIVDIALLAWCKNNISTREMSKFTGYDIWYKMID